MIPSVDRPDLGSYMLARLVRLRHSSRVAAACFDPADWRVALLRKACFSTYGDCLALGVDAAARAILAEAHDPSGAGPAGAYPPP